jgi:very-short-patch-repair endonuclease
MKIDEAFKKSLVRFAESHKDEMCWTRHLMGFNDCVAESSENLYAKDIDIEFGATLITAIGKEKLPFTEINEAAESCQSPIELMMYFALVIIGYQRFTQVWLDPKHSLWEPRLASMYDLISIQPQETIGPYRVDFLVTIHDRFFGPSGTNLRSHSVIVECDGHDFHEKTKEQASKDKKRDRFLQKHGLAVLRFSGSDVWKDAFSHANEVIEFITDKTEQQDIEKEIDARNRT